jgi:NAD(P)-dependent dehydrogenase (short-subunit alcohol dehydrogenase family)
MASDGQVTTFLANGGAKESSMASLVGALKRALVVRSASRASFGKARWAVPVALAAGATLVCWAFRRKAADLSGRVAMVTGGSRGLGFLVARELGLRGCHVAICARDAAELEAAAERLRGMDIDAVPVAADVADAAQARNAVGEVMRRFGALDVLVNDAGIIQVGPLESLTLEDFQRAMSVNFWGTVNTTLAALPHMRAGRYGRIANVTSIGGKVSVPHLLPYACAKFAAVGFSEGLRAHLAGSGVRVTTVVPGLMRTGSHRFAQFKGDVRRERAWFRFAAELPGLAMDAERAARRIVAAIGPGRAVVVLGVPAKLLWFAKELFPRLTLGALGAANTLLPSAAAGPGASAEA